MPPGEWEKIGQRLHPHGTPYPPEYIKAANREREQFIHILESEGVIVRRIEDVNYATPFGTPDWSVSSGFCGANPRDPFLVIGNEIIETPMADRSRYFEAWAYRELFKEYFRGGAKWTAAPKPLPCAFENYYPFWGSFHCATLDIRRRGEFAKPRSISITPPRREGAKNKEQNKKAWCLRVFASSR